MNDTFVSDKVRLYYKKLHSFWTFNKCSLSYKYL